MQIFFIYTYMDVQRQAYEYITYNVDFLCPFKQNTFIIDPSSQTHRASS